MPKLDESHKEILFASWGSQFEEVEQETQDAAVAGNNVIESVNENLHSANLVEETTLVSFQMKNNLNYSGNREQKKEQEQLDK